MITMGTPESGAIFSDCMKYRFRLWRVWDSKLPRALFCMLNPSSATEYVNDPTIERQQRRVLAWSNQSDLFSGQLPSKRFGSIEVVNACAWRSTDPSVLFDVEDPVGDDNGGHIHDAARFAIESGGIVICGWGTHLLKLGAIVSHGTRAVDFRNTWASFHDQLVDSLRQDGIPLSAFKLNEDFTPAHPLYLPYELKPRRWSRDELHEEVI